MTEEPTPIPTPSSEQALPSVEDEMKEYKDKYLRLLAEMDNTRKRMQKEKQEMTRFAVDNIITELLSPLDNLENALGFTQGMSEEVRKWAQGFEMILGQFKEVLSNQGVVPFHCEGMKFDPELHHAIETEESSDKPEGTILKEYVKGYRRGDHTLRPARVKVAVPKGKEPSAQENNHLFNQEKNDVREEKRKNHWNRLRDH